jgi:hypothetical protein
MGDDITLSRSTPQGWPACLLPHLGCRVAEGAVATAMSPPHQPHRRQCWGGILHLFRGSSVGSRYSRPSGPMADTWVT